MLKKRKIFIMTGSKLVRTVGWVVLLGICVCSDAFNN